LVENNTLADSGAWNWPGRRSKGVHLAGAHAEHLGSIGSGDGAHINPFSPASHSLMNMLVMVPSWSSHWSRHHHWPLGGSASARSSTKLFHWPQSGQRPSQRGL